MGAGRLTRAGIAYRVAQDLPDGSYVNLGFGIPILITHYLPRDRDIFIHTENGILGAGEFASPGAEDPDIVNAAKQFVTLRTGAAIFDHATAFAMIRGGHLTHAVMGALQVSARGDLANWRGPGEQVPGVGGAMDLAVGVPNVFITMTHVTSDGTPKIVAECDYPLTARRCVTRIFTDLAVIDVSGDGLVLREVAPGLDPQAVQACTGAPLALADDWREMPVPPAVDGTRLLG